MIFTPLAEVLGTYDGLALQAVMRGKVVVVAFVVVVGLILTGYRHRRLKAQG